MISNIAAAVGGPGDVALDLEECNQICRHDLQKMTEQQCYRVSLITHIAAVVGGPGDVVLHLAEEGIQVCRHDLNKIEQNDTLPLHNGSTWWKKPFLSAGAICQSDRLTVILSLFHVHYTSLLLLVAHAMMLSDNKPKHIIHARPGWCGCCPGFCCCPGYCCCPGLCCQRPPRGLIPTALLTHSAPLRKHFLMSRSFGLIHIS